LQHARDITIFLFTKDIKHSSSSSEKSSDSDEFNIFIAYIANAAINVIFLFI